MMKKSVYALSLNLRGKYITGTHHLGSLKGK